MKNCVHCGAHLVNDWCFECDLPQGCQHERVWVRSKHYPATRYEPPELVIYYAECKLCNVVLDEGDIPRDADLEEL